MRLLNTRSGHFEEFIGTDMPEYAILSHTWGKDEVSFEEYSSLLLAEQSTAPAHVATRQKSGFVKITKFTQLAASQGYDYGWVDTCCIDKRSSADLSEAINSMYHWYQKAKVCCAYLADVETLGVDLSDADEIARIVRPSRWFTRGWTLQELIAPKELYFYSNAWDAIASREMLRQVVARLTGISDRAFGSTDLSNFPIAERMSWASQRQTTRPEDTAYCLMGIFNVSMPLLYGEGDKAFMRLQEHIAAATTDHSLFAWNMDMPEAGGPTGFQESFANHRGLFARSPSEFGTWRLNTREILRWAFSPSEAFSQTNRGLHLSVPVFKAHEAEAYLSRSQRESVSFSKNEVVAVLNCATRARDSLDFYYIGLVLAMTDPRIDGKNGFMRVGNCVLLAASGEHPIQNHTDNSKHALKREIWVAHRLVMENKLYSSLRVTGVRVKLGGMWIGSPYPIDPDTNIAWCPPRPQSKPGGMVVAVVYLQPAALLAIGFPDGSEELAVTLVKELDAIARALDCFDVDFRNSIPFTSSDWVGRHAMFRLPSGSTSVLYTSEVYGDRIVYSVAVWVIKP